MNRQAGFTLVELMIVSAIVAILASVATPAYINYQNRGRQTEAVEAVLRAKMDQEAYWAENGRYADTITRLFSFGNSASGPNTYNTSSDPAKGYQIRVTGAAASTKTIRAVRLITSTGQTDAVIITTSPDDKEPTIVRPTATKFSVFQWLFG